MLLTHGNPLQEQYPTTKPQHGAACIIIAVGCFTRVNELCNPGGAG